MKTWHRSMGNWLGLVSACGLLMASAASAEKTSGLPTADRAHLMKSDSFAAISHVSELPAAVREKLLIPASGKKAPEYAMADPGKPWNPGCVVDGTPSRRLLFAAVSKDHCVVAYESGGIAHMYRANLYRLGGANGGQTASPVWAAYISPKTETLDSLRKEIRSGSVHEIPRDQISPG